MTAICFDVSRHRAKSLVDLFVIAKLFLKKTNFNTKFNSNGYCNIIHEST